MEAEKSVYKLGYWSALLASVSSVAYDIGQIVALQTFYHPLIWGASLWAVTLPGATISLAVLFRRRLRDL